MVPALRRTTLFGGGAWVMCAMRPGEKPLSRLAAALEGAEDEPVRAARELLKAHGAGATLLLVVDQLEELFTVSKVGVDRFQEALLALEEVRGCHVVVTARADFYPDLMVAPLWRGIQAHRVEVTPLAGEGLRQAIVRPAESVGVFVEATLVDRLIGDAAREPGALPLIQETLVLLWERLERRLLPLRAYQALAVMPRKAYGEPPRTGLQVALSRRLVAVLSGHGARVSSLSFSLDGRTLASASWDQTVIVWDTVARAPRYGPLTGHVGAVLSVALSPDGRLLASGGADHTIRLWDLRSGRPLGGPLRGHSDWVRSLAFSPDGRTLASGSQDRTVWLWEVTGAQAHGAALSGPTSPTPSLAFSPDGRTLASGDADGGIALWTCARPGRRSDRRSTSPGTPARCAACPTARTGACWRPAAPTARCRRGTLRATRPSAARSTGTSPACGASRSARTASR
jgi:hypothetical protein